MTFKWLTAATAVALPLFLLSGCMQQTSTPVKVYEVKTPDPLDQAKSLLENYAKGQTPGSEVTTFPHLVDEVKKKDPQKGEILEKGFADLQKSPREAAAKAKALLGQL